ncbi:hypothetical protein GO986_18795 [Deinococcus sp. HMF7620]|uniref:Uncharacterized protein n=1 Tax=Deinococcus arboris TaxID=2682977 RepID=A0A7C9I5A4_9DEIO|nr:hypothetical protein [Deinococcus arboris]MVN88791.1 hypothetical protein [Deinococcus arboris]
MPASTPDLPARLLGPHVLLAHCELPEQPDLPVICEDLRRRVAQNLPVHIDHATASVQLIVASPEQVTELVQYLKYLQGLPRRALDEQERRLLDVWCP